MKLGELTLYQIVDICEKNKDCFDNNCVLREVCGFHAFGEIILTTGTSTKAEQKVLETEIKLPEGEQ